MNLNNAGPLQVTGVNNFPQITAKATTETIIHIIMPIENGFKPTLLMDAGDRFAPIKKRVSTRHCFATAYTSWNANLSEGSMEFSIMAAIKKNIK